MELLAATMNDDARLLGGPRHLSMVEPPDILFAYALLATSQCERRLGVVIDAGKPHTVAINPLPPVFDAREYLGGIVRLH